MPSLILVVLNISGTAIRDFVRVYYLVMTRDQLGPREAYVWDFSLLTLPMYFTLKITYGIVMSVCMHVLQEEVFQIKSVDHNDTHVCVCVCISS
jgi:hypothetical protein